MESPFMRRLNKRDSGYHGRKAEESLAKRLKGQQQPGSGALEGAKGDVKKDTSSFSFLVENKSTKGDSFSMQRDWLLKVYQEALEQGRVPALAFQFTNDAGKSEKRERWVAVPESRFIEILELLDITPPQL